MDETFSCGGNLILQRRTAKLLADNQRMAKSIQTKLGQQRNGAGQAQWTRIERYNLENSMKLWQTYGYIFGRLDHWSTLGPFSLVIFDVRDAKMGPDAVVYPEQYLVEFFFFLSCPWTWLENSKYRYWPILNVGWLLIVGNFGWCRSTWTKSYSAQRYF